MALPYLTIGLVAGFGALLMLAVTLSRVAVERRQVHRQLRQVEAWAVAGQDLRARELAAPLGARLLVPTLRRVTAAVRRFAPSGILERLDTDLELAGSPAGWDAERLLAAKILAAAGFVLAALGLGVPAVGLLRAAVLAIFGGAVGYYLPEWILRSQVSKRQEQIRRDLPDSLDLLSITVQAGLGFDAALSHVATQFEGPLAEEYNRLLKEMQLGKSRVEALRTLADRSTVAELRSFVLAMVQADAFGISISKVLHTQADELRIKRRQRAEETAQKLPVKILFPLVACVFPSLFVVLLGPAAIRIYDSLLSQ